MRYKFEEYISVVNVIIVLNLCLGISIMFKLPFMKILALE